MTENGPTYEIACLCGAIHKSDMAVVPCENCGEPTCDQCGIEYGDKMYCPRCADMPESKGPEGELGEIGRQAALDVCHSASCADSDPPPGPDPISLTAEDARQRIAAAVPLETSSAGLLDLSTLLHDARVQADASKLSLTNAKAVLAEQETRTVLAAYRDGTITAKNAEGRKREEALVLVDSETMIAAELELQTWQAQADGDAATLALVDTYVSLYRAWLYSSQPPRER